MKKAYIKYLLGVFIFGSNGIVASYISLASYEIVLLRSFLGIILLFALFLLTGNRPTVFKYKHDLLFIMLSGMAMAADWLFLFEAFDQIGVGLASVMNYFGPVIVVALSPFFFKEKLTYVRLISMFAALIGVFLVSGDIISGSANFWGLLCGILSAFSYAALVISDKKAEHIKGFENSVFQLFFAFLTVAVFVGIKQGFVIHVAAGDWFPILLLGFFNTGICCFLYFSSIGSLPAQTVAVCGYIEPLSAVVLAVLILHETMLPLQILGAFLIVAGALFGECYKPANLKRLM